MIRRLFPVLLLSLALMSRLPAGESNNTPANPEAGSNPSGSAPLVTPEARKAIRNGLNWLTKQQMGNGAIGSRYTVAATALSGMAFLAGGSLPPNRGRYGKNIGKAVDFLLRQARGRRGYISAGNGSRMHGHGYAVQFLAQVYGATRGTFRSGDLRRVLEKAIDLIVQAQDPTGGWTYTPRENGHEGSVTVTQIAALRACKNVGLSVPEKTIEKSMEYVKKSHVGNGGFSYRVGQGSARPGLTGAMVSTLNYTGVYGGSLRNADSEAAEIVKKGLRRLRKKNSPESSKKQYGGYVQFYEAQAFFFAGSDDWRDWYRSFLKTVLPEQSPGGNWEASRSGVGTAMKLIVLQLPYNYLPEMQR